MRALKPTSIHPPFSRYSHGIEVPAGRRLVVCAGQLGITADGRVPESVREQTELCFANISAILAEAGLTLADLVRINTFVSDRSYLADYREVRDRIVGDRPPASTLLIVTGFARPEFKIEIEVIAAAPE